MRLHSLLFTCFALLAVPAMAEDEDKFIFDKSHTRILFFISHLGLSQTVGDFTDYDGSFSFNVEHPEKGSVDVIIRPAGVHTPSSALDEHLQKEDFFNTAKFPDIHFVSKEVKVTGKNTGDVMGDLTMLGVTKPVVLHVTFNKADYHPMTGQYMAGFSATADIKRSEFGMNYGIPMVGDDVHLEVYTEGTHVTKHKPSAKHN